LFLKEAHTCGDESDDNDSASKQVNEYDSVD